MRNASLGVVAVTVVGLFLGIAHAAPEAAANADAWFAQGEALLKQGQVEQSSQSFLQAARLAPKNAAYVDRAMMLRRVVGMRRFVAKSAPSQRWEQSVKSLHLFYVQNGLPQLALQLDEDAHQKLKSAKSAAWLAESYLELGKNVEAANLLGEYSGRSPDLALLHAISLARLGRADAARSLRAAQPLPNDPSPGLLFDAGRVHSLLGEHEQGLAVLKVCFEKTPPAGLDIVKRRVRAVPDFQPLAALPAFETVMQTASNVKRTCSGGKDCGSCPLKGRCGGHK